MNRGYPHSSQSQRGGATSRSSHSTGQDVLGSHRGAGHEGLGGCGAEAMCKLGLKVPVSSQWVERKRRASPAMAYEG